jgi:hypothetical protein
VSENTKKGLNEQIRSQIEKLIEKCVVIGILTTNGEGLKEKHREKLAVQLIRDAYTHLIKCEHVIHDYNRNRLAVAYIKGDGVAEDLIC